MTLVQLALGHVNSRWFLGASIIGATTMEQLREDIAGAQIELDKETLQASNTFRRRARFRPPCRCARGRARGP